MTSPAAFAARAEVGFEFDAALERIGGLVWRTPLMPLEVGGTSVFLKLESLQRTGSFKIRGAANRLLKLSREERGPGVVAVSSGNHGRAVAEVARHLGIPATICVPDWVDPSKLRGIRAAGARLVFAGPSYDAAEDRAAELEAAEGMTPVHPFDDRQVIEGQGTIGVELAAQLPGIEEVIIPLSGGGLVAGIGLALKPLGVRVVAVSARRASVMLQSVEAGTPVRVADRDTIASALSGGIGRENRFTFDIVRDVVSEHVIVEEDDIRAAVGRAFRSSRLIVEGGGVVGLAALWSGYRPRGRAAVVVSGGNLDSATLAALAA